MRRRSPTTSRRPSSVSPTPPSTPSDFDTERLSPHLRMTFAVINERGVEVARSKDLAGLQQKLKTRGREAVARVSASTPHAIERSRDHGVGLRRAAEDRSRCQQGGTVIRAYPALVDHGDLRLDHADEHARRPGARDSGRRSPTRCCSASRRRFSYVREHLTQTEKLLLATSPYQNVNALFDDCLVACVDAGVRARRPDGILWTRAEFEATRLEVSAGLVEALIGTVATVSTILGAARDADRALRGATSMALVSSLADAREQLAGLVFPGFISSTGPRAAAPRSALPARHHRAASRSCPPSWPATAPGSCRCRMRPRATSPPAGESRSLRTPPRSSCACAGCSRSCA